jgi:uncharacterized protein (DUF362 family)
MVAVAVAQDAEIEPAITGALDRLSLDSLVRGKLVAVKPNDTWASPSDKTGVTQPDTLRAVLRLSNVITHASWWLRMRRGGRRGGRECREKTGI